ncbi:MAG TPA: AraC family transcriptional regulator [Roseiflexaceae bacterium]|nr:AraC family transcriptional regulator [Roseiflexaceae bacterium]
MSGQIWERAEMPGVAVGYGHRSIRAVGRHLHDMVQITRVLDGVVFFETPHWCLVAPAGSLLVLPPGVIDRAAARSSHWSFATIQIAPDLIAQLAGAAQPLPAQPLILRDPALIGRFRSLFRTLAGGPRPGYDTLLAGLLSRLPRQANLPALELPSPVARARAFLDRHYAEPIPLPQLARQAGLSESQLTRAFHAAIGLPPHAYQLNLRLLRARRMLAAGVPIAEVAGATGFADQSHLTRLFKRMAGVTPGQYALASRAPPPDLSDLW